jgi:pimeloyl-ACP methyl ester carboxylesterase
VKRLLFLSAVGARLALLGAVSCGDNQHPPRVLMDVSSAAPSYGRTPFPTDALREGPHLGRIKGLEAIVGQHADLIAAHLETIDGFGLRPTVEFFIEGPLDPDTIPATTRSLDDALFVLDVDPDTGESGAPLPFDWRYDPVRHVIAGSPAMGVQLREGTTYAAVITKDIKGPDGASVYSSYELRLVAHDPPTRWRTTSDAYKELIALPDMESRIAGLTVFTTQYASDGLVKARNEIANVASVDPPVLKFADPAIIFDTPAELDALLGQAKRHTEGPRSGQEEWGTDNPTGVAHDHIAVVATGTITIASFIGPDTGTDGPDDEAFELARDGVPVVRSTEEIPITFILPKGNVPPGGFPVILFGHGLGGSRRDALDLAEPLALQGYAVVAIDAWGHGSRFGAPDMKNNLGGKMDFTGNRELRDGFGDDPGLAAYLAFFESFMNFSAIRDKFRQSALDLSRVAMLIRNKPSLSALGAPYSTTPKLDPTKVAYLGESFGTVIGTNLAAIEPSIGLYILNVAGGGLLDYIMPNSPEIGSLAVPIAEQLFRTTGTLDRFHPLNGMLQAIFDAGDSLTFARHVLRDRAVIENDFLPKRHIVCIESMYDEIMPNVATEALARAFGLHVLTPNVEVPQGMFQIGSPGSNNVAGQTGILVQYEPATHGYNWAAQEGRLQYQPGAPFEGDERFPKLAKSFTIQEPIYETHAQVAEILTTYFAGQSPFVRSTKPPARDFDGDGKLDSVDPDPHDPAK